MTTITLPPLPKPVCYYWTPKQGSGIPDKLASWSTNSGPHPDWDVGRYYNEDELRARDLEVARLALEAAAYVLTDHQIPVGNSTAGELACQWTYDALKECRDTIRNLEFKHE